MQALPVPVLSQSDGQKPVGPPRYGISVFDVVSRTWERIAPVPKYPDGLPLFCQVTSSEGKLVVMGGWDPASYDPVKDMFIYDFTTRRWKQGSDMPSKRSFFAADEMEGRIYVAGGHDNSKNALSTAWVYDVRRDEWSELTRMNDERDECQGVVIGSEFWVVSGYGTENQGGFVESAESLDLGTGEWRRVESAWVTNQCPCPSPSPRSCVGVGKYGKLFNWAESDQAVGVGACGVDLGDWTLLTGSAYQGAPQGFFLVERKDGQNDNGKLERIEVGDEFSGFVQSGCWVEI